MTLKLYVSPQFHGPDRAEGGIRRVVDAQVKYLPNYGIEIVSTPEESDMTAVHAGAQVGKIVGPVVTHCHGLYWSRDPWPDSFFAYNREVIDNLKLACAWTAPSRWVADNISRGMLITPRVVYHGVDPSEWTPRKTPGDYILWNKARADVVSDPTPLVRLARLLPEIQFITTYGYEAENVTVLGTLKYPQMKEVIQNAGAYLSTTKETFGIGTLEAMASGIPVFGWDFGGNSEIVQTGKTGYLTEYGNLELLAETIRAHWVDRVSLGEAARQDVEENWTWEPRVKEYADLYYEVMERENSLVPEVSIVVSSYNLGKYLPETLESVSRQTHEGFECIVVDDCSTDNSMELAKAQEAKDSRFRTVRQDINLGVAQARNRGFKESHGKYILFLDADDLLTPNALALMLAGLHRDPALDIAYGGLDLLGEAGDFRGQSNWPNGFDWYYQIAHLDQIPYCAMMKRQVMGESGGYRSRVWLTEDAEFWTRVTSFGYTAKMVTKESTLRYRQRPTSRIRTTGGEGNWEAWFPWSLAPSIVEGQKIATTLNGKRHPHPERVPFGAVGEPANGLPSWEVHDVSSPDVSIIIPCSKKHQEYLVDALDSVVAQTFWNWEVVVVDDSPEGDLELWGHPYAKVVRSGGIGPASARNIGVRESKGEVVVFLDADDVLLPWAISHMKSVYDQTGFVVYTDWAVSTVDLDIKKFLSAPDDDCPKILDQMPHVVTCMVPRKAHDRIGGFDSKLGGWEDWDYYIHLAAEGVCSIRLPETCMIYRAGLGEQREKSLGKKKRLIDEIYDKWEPYYKGVKTMGCGCGKEVVLSHVPSEEVPGTQSVQGAIRLTYQGPGDGKQTFRGQATGTIYRFASGDTKWVDEADSLYLLELQRVNQPFFFKENLAVQPEEVQKLAQEFSTKPVGV